MLELDIQLFSDATSVDTSALTEEEKNMQDAAASLNEELEGAKQDISSLENDQALQSVAGDAIQKVFNYISPKLGEFQTVVSDLGTFLSFVVSTYEFSDEEMKKEFDEWSKTITGVVNNVKSGLNSTVPQGSYTTTQYVSEMSQSTRNIVKEVGGMIQKTGNLYTSATGKTVLTSVKDFGQAAVGTISTLFNSLGNGSFGSIGTSFVNSLLGSK